MKYSEKVGNEAEYETALARISDLMDALSGPQGQIAEESHPDRVELDSLVCQVEQCEDKHYPIDPPSAIDAIDQTGKTPSKPTAITERHGKA